MICSRRRWRRPPCVRQPSWKLQRLLLSPSLGARLACSPSTAPLFPSSLYAPPLPLLLLQVLGCDAVCLVTQFVTYKQTGGKLAQCWLTAVCSTLTHRQANRSLLCVFLFSCVLGLVCYEHGFRACMCVVCRHTCLCASLPETIASSLCFELVSFCASAHSPTVLLLFRRTAVCFGVLLFVPRPLEFKCTVESMVQVVTVCCML